MEDRFSLQSAALRQLELYRRAADTVPTERLALLAPGGTSAAKLAAYRVQSRVDQVRGRFSADDFNAKAVAGQRAA